VAAVVEQAESWTSKSTASSSSLGKIPIAAKPHDKTDCRNTD